MVSGPASEGFRRLIEDTPIISDEDVSGLYVLVEVWTWANARPYLNGVGCWSLVLPIGDRDRGRAGGY